MEDPGGLMIGFPVRAKREQPGRWNGAGGSQGGRNGGSMIAVFGRSCVSPNWSTLDLTMAEMLVV
eukprot:360962-Pyramimonas_sp.AAC.1